MSAVASFLSLLLAASMAAAQSQCVWQTQVNVLDQNGAQVTGLTTNSFEAQVGKRPLHMVSVLPETRARRVLILLDVSGSMHESPAKWDTALLMVKDAANRLPPEDPIGFATFGGALEFKIDFSRDRQALLDELSNLADVSKIRPQVGTAFFDAIADAATKFGEQVAGDLIYVISDGADNHSERSEKAVEEILQRRGIRLFILILDLGQLRRSMFRSPGEVYAMRSTGEFAANTGGGSARYSTATIERVPKDVQQQIMGGAAHLYQLMHSGYVLKVEIPQSVEKPEKWKLNVNQKRAKVLYSRQLFPCTSAPGLPSPQ